MPKKKPPSNKRQSTSLVTNQKLHLQKTNLDQPNMQTSASKTQIMTSNDPTHGSSSVKLYEVRPGTINKGKEYEFKIVALLSLRCVLLDAEDFWLASNAEGTGSFDDVILYTKKPDHEGITFMLQLKHKTDPKNIGCDEFFKSKDFQLIKYFDTIRKLHETISTRSAKQEIIRKLGPFSSIYFILFTNRRSEGVEFWETNSDASLALVNTSKGFNKSVHKLNVEKLPKCDVFKDVNLKVIASAGFYLLSNQVNVDHLNKEITKEIVRIGEALKLSTINAEEVVNGFVMHIADWYNGSLGGHFYLKKEDILCKLTELFLHPYMISLTEVSFRSKNYRNRHIWNEIVADQTVTVVAYDETTLDILLRLYCYEIQQYLEHPVNNWNDHLMQHHQQLFYKKHPHIKSCILKDIGNHGRLSPFNVYKSLWRLNKLSLLLKISNCEQYKNILNILKLSGYSYKVIILYENLTLPEEGMKPFETLEDLDEINRNKILQQKIKIQGRSGFILKGVVKENMFRYIKCADILNLLFNEFNIGKGFKSFPDYFINRTIIKTVIKPEILTNYRKEIFLMQGKFENMKHLRNYKVVKANEVDFSNSKNIPDIIGIDEDLSLYQMEKLKLTKKPIHVLCAYNDNYFQLKRSTHPNNIDFYKTKAEYVLKEETISTYLGTTTIIEAVPGMGKTILMDYLTHFVPINMWVLKIDLSSHHSYFRQQNCRNQNTEANVHLKYFYNAVTDNEGQANLCEEVFQYYVASRMVIIFLDGFDEVADCYRKEVTNIIKSLDQEGYPICITTRPLMKQYLEEILGTISDTIKPFTIKDQSKLLRNYFNRIHNPKNQFRKSYTINKFVQELLQAASENLKDKDAEFIGVPLQTKLLADAFSCACEQYISNKRIGFVRTFDLLFLYETFVENKMNIYLEKYGESARRWYNHIKQEQSLFALQLIFHENFFKEMSIVKQLKKTYANDKDKIQQLEQLGIILVSNANGTMNLSCVHRTIAEYLSAEWLIENSASTEKEVRLLACNLIKTRFWDHYDFLFYIFDRIATRDCVLHQSILNKKYEEAENIINADNDSVNKIDKVGRNALHVIAQTSTRLRLHYFTDFSFPEDSKLEIIREKVLKQSTVCNKTDVIGYTAVDYALEYNCLEAADAIQKKVQVSVINVYLDLFYKKDYLCYCIYSFPALLRLLLPYFISRELILKNIDKDCTVEDYVEGLIANSGIESIHEYKRKSALELSHGYSGYAKGYYNDLRYAIALGSKHNIEELLSDDSEFDDQDIDANTSLHYAALHQQTETVQLLLYKGARVNKQNKDGNAPLHLAILKFNLEIIKILIKSKADVNISNKTADTPLHLISRIPIPLSEEHKEAVTIIIGKGCDVNARNKFDLTPLHLTSRNGYEHMAELMIANGADVDARDNEGRTPLHLASKIGSENMAELIIAKGGNVNIKDNKGRTALHLASFKISELIISNEKNNHRDLDARSGYKNIIELIITKGGNINAKDNEGNTPLHLASFKIVEAIINTNIAWKHKNFATLIIGGHKDIAELIITKGGGLNIENNQGEIPLHVAARDSNKDVAELMIAKGVSVNTKNKEGDTPLHYASRSGYKSMTEFLITKGGDVNAKNNEGETPLHLASRNGYKDIVELIITKGGYINEKDNQGRTSLDLASKNLRSEVVKLLISKGAEAGM